VSETERVRERVCGQHHGWHLSQRVRQRERVRQSLCVRERVAPEPWLRAWIRGSGARTWTHPRRAKPRSPQREAPAHGLLYHSTSGLGAGIRPLSRVIKKTKKKPLRHIAHQVPEQAGLGEGAREARVRGLCCFPSEWAIHQDWSLLNRTMMGCIWFQTPSTRTASVRVLGCPFRQRGAPTHYLPSIKHV